MLRAEAASDVAEAEEDADETGTEEEGGRAVNEVLDGAKGFFIASAEEEESGTAEDDEEEDVTPASTATERESEAKPESAFATIAAVPELTAAAEADAETEEEDDEEAQGREERGFVIEFTSSLTEAAVTDEPEEEEELAARGICGNLADEERKAAAAPKSLEALNEGSATLEIAEVEVEADTEVEGPKGLEREVRLLEPDPEEEEEEEEDNAADPTG